MLWNLRNQSKLTESWCQKWKTGKPTLAPPVTENHVVVTIIEPIHQSSPSPTIQYTYNEKFEGLWCCDILQSIQTYTILVWHVGYRSWNGHHPLLKSWGVVMIIHDELKSQPCKTIHYTYNKILEGLRCCELSESVQTHWILVSKVENR